MRPPWAVIACAHLVEEAVEQADQLMRQLPLGERREGAQIRHHHGQAAPADAAVALEAALRGRTEPRGEQDLHLQVVRAA